MSLLAMARRLALLGLFSAAPLVAGCSKEPPSTVALFKAPADGTYRLRGVVKKLPAKAGEPVVVSHEAIPEFQDKAGKKVGMMAMTMHFVPRRDAIPAGLAVGDKIAFDYEVRFTGQPMNGMAKVEKLPADTTLATK